MHIITTMNFKGENEIVMCKAWIYFAKRFNPDATITIIHHDAISDIQQFASTYHRIQFIKLSNKEMRPEMVNGYTDHPAQELKLAVWKQTGKNGIHKYIYVDSDAFILGSLDTWWSHINDKPYIAVHEQVSPYTPVFNAGVYSYGSKSGFVTYEKLLSQYRADNNRIKIWAGDQGLINAYVRRIGYDYTHPLIDFTYNCIAKWCRIHTISDRSINIVSGRLPLIQRVYKKVHGRNREWWEQWAWWNREKQVIILHAFGRKGFKFWELPECRPLWDYCKTVVKGK
jgi:hypothetical protein